MDMKRRILSCFLAFCMIFALLPAPAQAAGNAENATPTVTATVQHAETGQITAQIEAYMTDSANKTRTVKPCDIIFLIEQSQFMNTQNGSASSGDERAEILSAIDRLLDGMPQPTTGGEHRIAIAGYGRINNPGRSDGYNTALYPGTPSDNNDSLNTGYYTKDKDGKADFHSQSGWTEWNQIDGHTDATLPKLPSGYLTNTDGTDGYDDVFLTVDDAEQVINADTMVPWGGRGGGPAPPPPRPPPARRTHPPPPPPPAMTRQMSAGGAPLAPERANHGAACQDRPGAQGRR